MKLVHKMEKGRTNVAKLHHLKNINVYAFLYKHMESIF